MTAKYQWVVVSDLDGSLLNHHNYRWDAAIPSIRQLQQLGMPIIFNTSKTYPETLELQKQLGIEAPFVVENGSCVYLPKSRFQELPSPYARARNGFWEIKYGMTIKEINRHLGKALDPSDKIIMLSACTPEQASKLTGLSEAQAAQAISREFSQPMLWGGKDSELDNFIQRLQQQGLNVLRGGRFFHVQGKADKGMAIERLRLFFSEPIKTIVIGDSANDIEMLNRADIPVVVKAPGNQFLKERVNKAFLTSLEAPEGWHEAIQFALNNINQDNNNKDYNHG